MGNLTSKVSNVAKSTTMVMETMDQFGAVRETRKIEPGKHIYLPYRDGLVSYNPDIRISYKIYPENMDRSVGATLFPFDVFAQSEIKVSYDVETGDKVVLAYESPGGCLHRMSISRWLKDLFFE